VVRIVSHGAAPDAVNLHDVLGVTAAAERAGLGVERLETIYIGLVHGERQSRDATAAPGQVLASGF
jgi:hypothetical protein